MSNKLLPPPIALPHRQTNAEPVGGGNHGDPEVLRATYYARREKAVEKLREHGLEPYLNRANLELSGKQRAFIFEYLADPDRSPRNAALRAGYAEATANYAWDQLYWNPKIKAIIDKYEAGLLEKALITKQRVLNSLAAIAFSNITDYIIPKEDGSIEIDIEKLKATPQNGVQEITIDVGEKGNQKVRVRMSDKLAALNMLAKYLKMFEEPVQNTFLTVSFLDNLVKGKASVKDLPEANQVFDAQPMSELPEREVTQK